MQSWPVFVYPANFRVSTSFDTSASSNTTTGALPPSSRCTRLTVSAAAAWISLPVDVSPVTETRRTSALRTSWSPISEPWPVMTLITPGGKMSAESSASRSAVRGVSSAGLMTEVFPAASAGPIFHAAIISG